jgi:hypothetical protein
VPLPDFDIKTNNVINEIFVTISEIVDILKIIDPYHRKRSNIVLFFSREFKIVL